MSKTFKEGLARDRLVHAYPILAGAVAVSKPWTLVTDKVIFIQVMAQVKEDLDQVPGSLRRRVENFDVGYGPALPSSEMADDVYYRLRANSDRIGYWEEGHIGERFFMEDADAEAYITKKGFTAEELDWLWGFAQAIHALSDKPVERR